LKIIIDAMGGDRAPGEIIKGSVMALKEFNIHITLVGDKVKIEKLLETEDYDKSKLDIIHSTEMINFDESPTLAIRRKKDSSMVVGMKMVRDGLGDAFISAGSTGALLAGGLFIIGRIDGIDRPGLAPILPGKNGPFMLLDVGANAECKVQNIVQFATMGEIYMKKVLKKAEPKIALANIGAEEEKGTEFVKSCYKSLKVNKINFVGNIEGREILNGDVDVIVCDGFVGNIILKTFEGAVSTIFEVLKKEIMGSMRSKLGGLLLKPVFNSFKRKFDYTEYGGAILLGLNSPVIKAHGSSNSNAFKNAIKQAVLSVKGNIIDTIKEEIKKDIM
jgi:glycerol-3-phosphate acyltransferase PlsX